MRLINRLRFDRATTYYKVRGELRPLQLEILRTMQSEADRAYAEADSLYTAGKLRTRLSREEAIGNYVDRAVRRTLQATLQWRAINTSKDQSVRVIGREYNSSDSDLTFRIPDARAGKIAFDVTLTRKTLSTAQVRGFFDADFKPDTVIIIRPSQIGPNNSYAIVRPEK